MSLFHFTFAHSSKRTGLTILALALCACFPSPHILGGRRTSPLIDDRSSANYFRDSTRRSYLDDTQPLKITAEIMSQTYCPDDDNVYDAIFKLRMRFTNQTKTKLIVDKIIGHGVYGIVIASDAKNLSAGKNEYELNMEGATGHVPSETPGQFSSPAPYFSILAPGESVETMNDFWLVRLGSQHGSVGTRQSLQPGNHVLEVTLSTWSYQANPEEISKRWKSSGDLVYKTVKTGPLAFQLPSDPQLDHCKR
jgi:hypothetical protein